MHIPASPYLAAEREKRICELAHIEFGSLSDLDLPRTRGFRQALAPAGAEWPHLIAELMRRSNIVTEIDNRMPLERVNAVFESAGVRAISVHTSATFGGTFEDLCRSTSSTTLPIMCFDFIVDARQIMLARRNGASAVILITGLVDKTELEDMIAYAHQLEMDALVEVSSELEIEMALDAGAQVIGINNRNLFNLAVDLQTTPRLAKFVPPGIPIVSESGFLSQEDVKLVVGESAGRVSALLVGSIISKQPDEDRLRRKILELRGLT